MKMPPRSIFARMPLEELVEGARRHRSRGKYLRALGFRKRACLGLQKRMDAEDLDHSDLWPNPRSTSIDRNGHHELDLTNDLHAYFYGLCLADGHLRGSDRNRGYAQIELGSRDEAVLLDLSRNLPWRSRIARRTRTTNFGSAEFSSIRISAYDLRQQLAGRGFPVGPKSRICMPPNGTYAPAPFWRGFIDGDGSIGFTGSDLPFVSLITSSQYMAQAYKDFIGAALGVKPPTTRPNRRDGVWNILLTRSNACQLAEHLYPPGCIAIERKRASALELAASTWKGRPKRNRWSYRQELERSA
jgi:hypothetical protein